MSQLTKKRLPVYECMMLVFGLLYVSPVLIALFNSFKQTDEILASPVALPMDPTLQNYINIFSKVDLLLPMFNSLLMASIVIICLVLIAPMAAYSLMRRRMRTATFWKNYFIMGLMIPFQVIMIPLLQQFRFLNIQFTYFSLLLVYVGTGLPLCVFIYSGFMATIPKGLEEAAAIDGCGQFRTFWYIIFPLLKPCTTTIVIFWGLWIWNDFLMAFIFHTQGELAFIKLWNFFSDNRIKDWGTIFAGVIILSMPVTVLFLVMQQKLVKGLTDGAVK